MKRRKTGTYISSVNVCGLRTNSSYYIAPPLGRGSAVLGGREHSVIFTYICTYVCTYKCSWKCVVCLIGLSWTTKVHDQNQENQT